MHEIFRDGNDKIGVIKARSFIHFLIQYFPFLQTVFFFIIFLFLEYFNSKTNIFIVRFPRPVTWLRDEKSGRQKDPAGGAIAAVLIIPKSYIQTKQLDRAGLEAR